MLASIVGDKYGQSQAITRRAEEASELMIRTEPSDEILSARQSFSRSENKCFSWRLRWSQMTPTAPLSLVHSSIRLTPGHHSSPLQLHLPLLCNINSHWCRRSSNKCKHAWSRDGNSTTPLFQLKCSGQINAQARMDTVGGTALPFCFCFFCFFNSFKLFICLWTSWLKKDAVFRV